MKSDEQLKKEISQITKKVIDSMDKRKTDSEYKAIKKELDNLKNK